MELHAAARDGSESSERVAEPSSHNCVCGGGPFRVTLCLGIPNRQWLADESCLIHKGPVAAANRTILIDSVCIMLAIVVPTIVAILAFAFWFRAVQPAARTTGPTSSYSGRDRDRGLGDPRAHRDPARRRRLDRLASARSRAARRRDRQPGRGSRSSRSTGNGCSSIPDQSIATVNTLTVPAGRRCISS